MGDLQEWWYDRCAEEPLFAEYMQSSWWAEYMYEKIGKALRPGNIMRPVIWNPYNELRSNKVMTKILGLAFLMAIAVKMNTDMEKDHVSRLRVAFVAKHLRQHMRPKDRRIAKIWVQMDSFVNTVCMLNTYLAMLMVLWLAENPKDIVFDALGLLFLYNLDDLGSNLDLITEKEWDPKWMGLLYSQLLTKLADRPDHSMPQGLEERQLLDSATHVPKVLHNFLKLFFLTTFFFVGIAYLGFAMPFFEPEPTGKVINGVAQYKCTVDDFYVASFWPPDPVSAVVEVDGGGTTPE